jgi:hypothetical protein
MRPGELQQLVNADDLERLFEVVTVEEIADAWWRCTLSGDERFDHPDWWAIELWLGTSIYEMKDHGRKVLRALAERAPDGADLGLLGAGPVEDSIADDEESLRWIENEARRSDNYREALGKIWRHDLRPDAFLRIEAAAGTDLSWPKFGHGPRPTRS